MPFDRHAFSVSPEGYRLDLAQALEGLVAQGVAEEHPHPEGFSLYSLADFHYAPAYATSVGLLKWEAKKSAGEELHNGHFEGSRKVFRHFLFRNRERR